MRKRPRRGTQRPPRLTACSEQTPREHLELTGTPLEAWTLVHAQVASFRFVVQQHAHHLRARHPVHGRVMHLRQQCDAAVVKTLDHVQLPQRARAVKRPRDDPRDLLGQLPGVTRSRQRQLAHVVLDVEGAVIHPVGVVESERHRSQAPAKRRQQVQPAADQPSNERHVERLAGCGLRVVGG